MSEFKAFLKGNVGDVVNAQLKLERFSEPISLRPLTPDEGDAITKLCYINKAGKKGKQEREFDVAKYNREICLASIVHPDLNNTEIQESYGVMGADSLYSKLFLLGEANEILQEIMDISGFNSSIDEEIEKAKN